MTDFYREPQTKESRYQKLCNESHICKACPRVFHDLTYLNANNGNLDAEVMFIGEAPGFVNNPKERGVAFHGNKSGDNFEMLLRSIGLKRSDVFVTNALLHTPVKPTNYIRPFYGGLTIRPPSTSEILNCSVFLRQQIDLVDPRIVVTLGAAALAAVQAVEPHDLYLWRDVATIREWQGRFLMPLYHPSPNVTANKRPLRVMLKDFDTLSAVLAALTIAEPA